jgi:hypothetical protein
VGLLERRVHSLSLLVGHLLHVDVVLPRGDLFGDVPDLRGALRVLQCVDRVPTTPVREHLEQLVVGDARRVPGSD